MRTAPERLCPLERILDAAGGVLDFSYHLIGLALGFQLGIAKHLGTLPATSLILPLISFTDPSIRSLSMIYSPKK